jgi:hypothetical protein
MQQFLHLIIRMFIYSSTCFWRPHAHHQELNNFSSSLWFYRWSVVVAVLLVVVGLITTNQMTSRTGLCVFGKVINPFSLPGI